MLGPQAEPAEGSEAEVEEATVDGEDTDAGADTEQAETNRELLLGLHAKLYVGDTNDRAYVWTGSANATDAAFSKNVEFLAELEGDRESCGTATLLEEKAGAVGFRNLLEPYRPEEAAEPDDAEEELESLAEGARYALARARFEALVETMYEESAEAYDVVLEARDTANLPGGPGFQCGAGR